jgi:nucleoside-diphosphate-sugar epimerase
MKIALTGTTGFVGKRLMEYNKDRFFIHPINIRNIAIAPLDLTGMDAIVHLAGKAHQMTPVEDQVYFEVNYELTKNLAEQAKKSGVEHFVYISSTKVYGDDVNEVLNEQSVCKPTDAYGESKLKAEKYLLNMQSDDFKISIIRPPLIYGPGVKGNMNKLLSLAAKKYPLPFGSIRNARSMVFIDNLIELINIILEKKAKGVFIAGDLRPVSTSELIKCMREHLGNKSKLIAVPGFMRSIIRILKPGLYARLFGSFVVDNTSTNNQLNFMPPYTTDEGIEQMADWFRNNSNSNK